jgi:hypothetical protein
MLELLRDGLAGLGAGFLVYLFVAAGRKIGRKALEKMDSGILDEDLC